MPRRSQRHRSTNLPFNYLDDGIRFEPESYIIDGGEETEFDLDPGQTQITLDSLFDDPETDAEWESITIHATVELPETTVDYVFPEGEHASPPATLYVTVRCHETIYRHRNVASEPPTSSGVYSVEIPIQKEVFRGQIELRPYLVRGEEAQGISDRYASKPNTRLASGTIYTVFVDSAEVEELPAIDGEHVSFSQNPHLPDGEKLYYLDFRNERRPKLWINADHPRITEILQSRGSVGAEARMRDVILDQISYGVWMQLLIRAGSAVDDNGNTEYEWQQTVLETFVRNMYGLDDLEEATLRLREEIRDPDQLPHLVERLDKELQEYIDPRTQLINLMEEGLHL